MKIIISVLLIIVSINTCIGQNVGIGITTPLTPLHIKATSSEILRVQGTNPYISLYDNTDGYRGYLWYNGSSIQLGSAGGSNLPVTIGPNYPNIDATFLANGNVGIGTGSPTQKLDVAGTTRTTTLMISGTGTQSDFLVKGTGDNVTSLKGHNGLGLNYIIAVQGIYPSPSGGGTYNQIILGEIRLFAGNFAPTGFMFCQGQLLAITSNTALFSLLGTTYGGDGSTTFALPDLRAAVPVGFGTTGTGPSWTLGERSQ